MPTPHWFTESDSLITQTVTVTNSGIWQLKAVQVNVANAAVAGGAFGGITWVLFDGFTPIMQCGFNLNDTVPYTALFLPAQTLLSLAGLVYLKLGGAPGLTYTTTLFGAFVAGAVQTNILWEDWTA